MGAIRLEDTTKRFGDVLAVDGIDIEIRDGELLVLVGPSGCGKTTLLRTIAGLETPSEGEVYIGDRRVTPVPARKRDVALVFQNFALFPHMSVRENVSFNLRMQGGYDRIDERVEDAAEMLGIAELLDRNVNELSGGQKQRVALGRAIVTEPEAFLLDEPLANLDAKLRDRMQTEIARLQDRLGITTVHVTHNQREAMTMGDRVAVLNDGKLQQIGRPEDVYTRPANLFVARFVGSPTMNLVEGSVTQDGAVALDGDEETGVAVSAGIPADYGRVTVGVRPERVGVAASVEDGPRWLTSEIAFVEFHGADKFVYLQPAGLSEIVARVEADADLRQGQRVSVTFDPDHVHVFDPESGDRIESDGASTDIREAFEDV